MKHNAMTLALVAVALFTGIWIGTGLDGFPGSGNDAGPADEGEGEVLYWVAPMDPEYRRDEPGKSPMGMDLVPVYAGEEKDGDGVTISPAVVNNLGVRTEAAKIRPLWRRIEATGYVSFDETRINHVNLRTEGWIERLLVNAEGERVAKGELLFELYSPELVNAQKEYIQAHGRGDARLKRGAEEKLRALGMILPEIRGLERSGQVKQTIQVVAPQDGIVMALNVREGMYVQPNTTVMSLADLSSVWLQAEIFESQAEWVAEGQAAEARLDYMPGTEFGGQVDYVYPVLDPTTRTLRVRLRFDNPDERLKPNMYARVSIYGRLRPSALAVPREALIRTPGYDRVVVAVGNGRFHVHEVLTGMESGEWVEIVAGIEPGDEVVTSAQFLIDSEASLAGSIHRLDEAGATRRAQEPVEVFASGWIEAIDQSESEMRVSHGPIDELGWPSMTMDFEVAEAVDLGQFRPGQNIQFVLRQGHAGEFRIQQVRLREDGVNPTSGAASAADTTREADGVAANPPRFAGRATIRSMLPNERRLKLAHEPIEALGWPAMVMDFAVADGVDLSGLKPGQDIEFVMRKEGERYVISAIEVIESARKDHGDD